MTRLLTDTAFVNETLSTDWIDGTNWLVTRPYVYQAPEGRVVVDAGFVTDFASIPKILTNILPPTGPYGPAAVLHDWMYRRGVWFTNGPRCTLAEANRVLHLAMVDLDKVPRWQRIAVDAGVAIGGWKSWNAYRRRELAAEVGA